MPLTIEEIDAIIAEKERVSKAVCNNICPECGGELESFETYESPLIKPKRFFLFRIFKYWELVSIKRCVKNHSHYNRREVLTTSDSND